MLRAYHLAAIVSPVLLLAVAACGEESAGPSDTPTPPPSATPVATRTSTAQILDDLGVTPLEVGEKIDLPEGVALIVELGCTQCDGPTTGLARVYRNAAGEVKIDTLFERDVPFLPGQQYITGFGIAADASQIVVSVCERGWCGQLGYSDPDARTVLFRSRDGGVTWEDFGTVDGGHSVVAMAQDGVVLASQFDPAADPGQRFFLFPKGEPLTPPAGGAWPLALPDDGILWLTNDGRRLLRGDGSELLDAGPGSALLNQANHHRDPSGQRLLVLFWREGADPQSGRYLLGLVGAEDGFVQVFSSTPAWVIPGPWLDSAQLIASAYSGGFNAQIAARYPDGYVGNVPVVIDLEQRLIRPVIDPFLDPPFASGRNYVQAMLRGPFARVVHTGSCLNIRAEPSATAEVLHCAADSVLLRDWGETRQTAEGKWIRVTAPGGIEGWASTQYLER